MGNLCGCRRLWLGLAAAGWAGLGGGQLDVCRVPRRAGRQAGQKRARGRGLRFLPRKTRRISPPGQHPQTGLQPVPPGPAGGLRPRSPRPGARSGRRRAGLRRVPRQRARIAAAQIGGFPHQVPDTCGMCHSEVVEQYRASVHGQALAQGHHAGAALHRLPRRTLHPHAHQRSFPGERRATFAIPAETATATCSCRSRFGLPADRLVSFDASFHGLAAKEGNETVANCASCHGVHNILPSSDPQSTINPKNLREDLRQMPPGRRNPFRHQPGARGGRPRGSARRCAGCGSFICC